MSLDQTYVYVGALITKAKHQNLFVNVGTRYSHICEMNLELCGGGWSSSYLLLSAICNRVQLTKVIKLFTVMYTYDHRRRN